MIQEADPQLAALTQELRVTLNELNQLHHPVYPSDPEQIAASEAHVAELKSAIKQRKTQLKNVGAA